MKAVFLDRDGVINRVTVRDGHAYSPRSRREFEILNGVPAAMARLRAARYRVVVVSNQPDIARNKLSPKDLEWMTDEIRRELAVDDVVVCPHGNNACEEFRKLRGLLDKLELAAKIIAGSTREILNVIEWLDAGAHIVTVVPNLLEGMLIHPYSKETVKMFLDDAVKLTLS